MDSSGQEQLRVTTASKKSGRNWDHGSVSVMQTHHTASRSRRRAPDSLSMTHWQPTRKRLGL